MTDRYIADLTFYFSSQDHGPSRSFSSRSFTDQRLAILDAITRADSVASPGGNPIHTISTAEKQAVSRLLESLDDEWVTRR